MRRLCALPGERHADGNSSANLLYHSLAMSQVLSSPPTLARWQRRGLMHRLWIVFFLPAAAHSWTVWTDWHTRAQAKVYGAHVWKLMAAEFVIAACLWSLSTVAFLNARAMTRRWERAFFRVNPSRVHVDQMAWWEWMKLRRRAGDWRTGRVITELVDTLTVRDRDAPATVDVEVTREVPRPPGGGPPRISRPLIQEMAQALKDAGADEAGAYCARIGAAGFELERFTSDAGRNLSELGDERSGSGGTWTVRGTWTFRCNPGDSERKAQSAP